MCGCSNDNTHMRFFIGLHQPSDTRHFGSVFVSVNRLRERKKLLEIGDWIMDSGAFTTIAKHGRYPDSPRIYAEQIKKWKSSGNLLAAVSQDYMCEAVMLKKTGLTVADHQRLTIQRYDELDLAWDTGGVYVMPVLQGYAPADYVAHVRAYGDRLPEGAWVGVGSVCKRNGDPQAVQNVLAGIITERPDLRLHGFGLKATALGSKAIRDLLYSADSMAWSFAARWEGRNRNSWQEAKAWSEKILDLIN